MSLNEVGRRGADVLAEEDLLFEDCAVESIERVKLREVGELRRAARGELTFEAREGESVAVAFGTGLVRETRAGGVDFAL